MALSETTATFVVEKNLELRLQKLLKLLCYTEGSEDHTDYKALSSTDL